jgi:hypothetical protein
VGGKLIARLLQVSNMHAALKPTSAAAAWAQIVNAELSRSDTQGYSSADLGKLRMLPYAVHRVFNKVGTPRNLWQRILPCLDQRCEAGTFVYASEGGKTGSQIAAAYRTDDMGVHVPRAQTMRQRVFGSSTQQTMGGVQEQEADQDSTRGACLRSVRKMLSAAALGVCDACQRCVPAPIVTPRMGYTPVYLDDSDSILPNQQVMVVMTADQPHPAAEAPQGPLSPSQITLPPGFGLPPGLEGIIPAARTQQCDAASSGSTQSPDAPLEGSAGKSGAAPKAEACKHRKKKTPLVVGDIRQAEPKVRPGEDAPDLEAHGPVGLSEFCMPGSSRGDWEVAPGLVGLLATSPGAEDLRHFKGVKVGNTGIPVNVFDNTRTNVVGAITERIVCKQREFVPTEEDEIVLCKAREFLIKHVFTEDAIKEVISHLPDLSEACSAKWSPKRFEEAWTQLQLMCGRDLELKASIKTEALVVPLGKPCKPPRLLIADGDVGLIAALASIVVMEKVMFRYYHDHCIKGRAKAAAMRDVCKGLRGSEEAMLVEGDGSAWDTTCSSGLRGRIENPILQHISEVLARCGYVPEEWLADHVRLNELPVLTLKFADKSRPHSTFEIRSIRRSGHRGTSGLNFLTNLVCWAAVLTLEPGRFLDKDKKLYPCRYVRGRGGLSKFMRERSWKGFFEGDDSLLRLDLDLYEHRDELVASWTRLGFNMKLVWHKGQSVAVFTGCEMLSGPTGLLGPWQPEVCRGIGAMAYTTSTEAINVITEFERTQGGSKPMPAAVAMKAISRIACLSYLARAHANSRTNRPAAMLQLALARGARKQFEACGGDWVHTDLDRETRMQVLGVAATPMLASRLMTEVTNQAAICRDDLPVMAALKLKWPDITHGLVCDSVIEWMEDVSAYLPIPA